MELTDAQKQAVARWVSEGIRLADIQSRLLSEFGIAATFMDVRFLIIDLGLELKDAASSGSGPVPQDGELAAPPAGQPGVEPVPAGGVGNVAVDIDRVVKPGSVVSGNVTFSDGVTATWALDQLGRLAINADREGYRPSENDISAFQRELQVALERRGF